MRTGREGSIGGACFQITIFGMFIFTFIKLTICLLSDCEGEYTESLHQPLITGGERGMGTQTRASTKY